ncbi:hypothetical protein Rsub_10032 [Raphidocelis subcapitata]|uniref:Phosphatidylglycerophosphatase n=1 Tax=Raphidocelis subcapitata TaxID=307507 RepID=A0A2V0PBU9_9CHLO|nr:hypothetical protein Rsub_10032 [Raphidocelis subcapitata]|eukprot:GBF97341.1 hypothetical protein Rsub_10032 [Raphidocelis subcapitata]
MLVSGLGTAGTTICARPARVCGFQRGPLARRTAPQRQRHTLCCDSAPGGSGGGATGSSAAGGGAPTTSSSGGGGGAPGGARHSPGAMNKLLQNVNVAGTSLFFQILASDQRLAVPHISVADISWVKWDALRAAGFKAAVFDKDNTLCEPFALEIDPRLRASVEAARRAFGGRLAVYSNSAGLQQYDPEGREASELEAAFDIHCLRHRDKKPAGSCDELEAHFGCSASEVVFIGDRYLTDVVFGNRHGMLTIRVAPLTLRGEPPGVLAARRVEEWCVSRWAAAGVKAPENARMGAQAVLEAVEAPAGREPMGGGRGGG